MVQLTSEIVVAYASPDDGLAVQVAQWRTAGRAVSVLTQA